MTAGTGQPDQPKAFLRELGQRVKAYREAEGITQSRLERDTGLRHATIAALERGEEDIWVHQLARVAERLDVALTDLIPSTPVQSNGPRAASDWCFAREAPHRRGA